MTIKDKEEILYLMLCLCTVFGELLLRSEKGLRR